MTWDPLSRLLFPCPPASYGSDSFPEEMIWVPKALDLGSNCPAEQRVPCLLLRSPSARFLVLYLHSNAEDLGKCYSFCHILRMQFQVHILAVEYPGYGVCPGRPATADTATENAFAVYRFVREVLRWPSDSIKVMGRSIGTGPAISLAVQYKVAGLILIAPFLSIKELFRDAVGPLSNLVEERFPSGERMHLVRSPVLIVHGQKDALVPWRHGVSLYERCRGRRQLVCPEDMEHNTNLLADPAYLVVPMLRFFSLPDYSFEDLEVPNWVFSKGPPSAARAARVLKGWPPLALARPPAPAAPRLPGLWGRNLCRLERRSKLDGGGGGCAAGREASPSDDEVPRSLGRTPASFTSESQVLLCL